MPLVVGGGGLLLLAAALWSARWPSVKGIVNISIYDTDDDVVSSGKKLHLSYAYVVGQRAYAGSRIALPGLAQAENDEQSSWRLREGVVVDVYYCPLWPKLSCLERGGSWRDYIVAAGCVAAAVWMEWHF